MTDKIRYSTNPVQDKPCPDMNDMGDMNEMTENTKIKPDESIKLNDLDGFDDFDDYDGFNGIEYPIDPITEDHLLLILVLMLFTAWTTEPVIAICVLLYASTYNGTLYTKINMVLCSGGIIYSPINTMVILGGVILWYKPHLRIFTLVYISCIWFRI
jgi:hypothetical protein